MCPTHHRRDCEPRARDNPEYADSGSGMSLVLLIAIVLVGLLTAFSAVHVYARWTIRNIDRQQVAVVPASDRPGSDPNE